MMTQYLAIKEQHKDAVVFFQVGGFYQLYYHDSCIAEKEFGMTRISRAIGGGKRAPMCGFPVSGGDKYASLFAEKGYRVIICKQQSDEAQPGKTVRVVSRIVEPEEEVVNLSDAWEQYLAENTFEDLQPPKKKKHTDIPTVNQEKEGLLLEQLAKLDLSNMTPLMALNLLQEWKESYIYGE